MNRIIEVFELDPIDMGDEEPLKFRVEVFERQGAIGSARFFARILRYETFKLCPTFPINRSTGDEAWDKELLVMDDHLGASSFDGESAQVVLSSVVAAVNGLKGSA